MSPGGKNVPHAVMISKTMCVISHVRSAAAVAVCGTRTSPDGMARPAARPMSTA
jgi:hypothetical protein